MNTVWSVPLRHCGVSVDYRSILYGTPSLSALNRGDLDSSVDTYVTLVLG